MSSETRQTAPAPGGELGALIGVLGRWWEDPGLTGLNRLPAATVGLVDGDDPGILDLAGRWDFRLLPRPEAAPAGWTTATDDRTDLPAGAAADGGWTTVAVPGCWTMQDVGDHPHYTNVVMPFGDEPGSVPAANPTGLYRTTFTVPDGWRDGRTVLHVGGAESAAALWCNGAFVGLMTDSRLPSEFDLTDLLGDGVNTLAVLVVRWAAATWIEDQDHWHHGGLHRRVHLRAVPVTSLADVRVTAGLDQTPGTDRASGADEAPGSGRLTTGGASRGGTGTATGTLTVTTRIAGPLDGHRIATRLETLDGATIDGTGAGSPVPEFDDSGHLAAMTAAYHHPGPVAATTVTVPDVRPWSHEDPQRYAVVVDLLDGTGAVVDSRRIPTGFRSVEIRGHELLLNGAPLLIAGVNRHDHNPTGGKTSTDDELRADVAAIKRCGFNAVRTSHYPPDPVVLDACDELGLWVICEANVEAHARWTELADDPRFTAAIIERTRRTVSTHWNHPAVMGWSLGNEAGDGAVFDAAAAWVRRTDPDRFVQYEGAVMWRWRGGFRADWHTAATDIECPMYPPVALLEEWATTTDRDKPLILCEYSHAMGNSNGGLADYWAAFERHDGLQGGFIWDWRDQGLAVTDDDGVAFFAYGGHFGDDPNDASFCCNGMVGPDLVPHPAVEEHRWLTRPVRTALAPGTAGDGGPVGLAVTNHRSFRGIDDLAGRVRVERDGEVLARLDLPPLSIPAGETLVVEVEVGPVPDGGERLLTIEWVTATDSPWAPAGHVVAWDQLTLPAADTTVPAAPTSSRSTVAPPLAATFDPDSGLLTAIVVDGRNLLVEPPVLALWRAPVDNDGVLVGPGARISGVTRRWLDQGLDRLERTTVQVTVDGRTTVGHHRLTSPTGISIDHVQRITVDGDGVRFDEEVVIPDGLDDLPRVGVRFALDAGLDRLTWFGPGPWETMPDRRIAPVGRWSSTVAEQYVPYVTPQHHGSHVDTRWFSLADGSGGGLRFDTGGLVFDASLHRVEDVTAAETTNQLRASGSVQVHLDAALRGAGTGACGPDTDVIVGAGTHRFTWALRPLGPAD